MNDTQRAVELLRAVEGWGNAAGALWVTDKMRDAIALLEPPKLSRNERIAREVEAIINKYTTSDALTGPLRNIAAILRET